MKKEDEPGDYWALAVLLFLFFFGVFVLAPALRSIGG